MFNAISAAGFESIFAADYSDAMLEVCEESPLSQSVSFSKQDIYSTTFSSGKFSAIVSSRFLFHSDDQDKLFSEFSRLLAPQGYLILDALKWSPRSWTQLFSNKLGGKIYTNSDTSIYKLAKAHGFEVIDSQSILIFPSFIYNFIPRFLMRPLQWLEPKWPAGLKSKKVWMLRKV